MQSELKWENLKTLFVGRAGVCFFSSLHYSVVYIACFYAYLYSQVSVFSRSCIPAFSGFDFLLKFVLCVFILLSQEKFSTHLPFALD